MFMGKGKLPQTIAIDRLLRDFASSPRANKLREIIVTCFCPRPEEVAEFCRGEWEEERAREFRVHLLGCLPCGQQVVQLRGGLPEELREHPADELLRCYANNLIPAGPPGQQLKREIAQHLESCGDCREQVNQGTSNILYWADIQRTLEIVRQLVQGLVVLAIAQRRLLQQVEVSKVAQRRTGRGIKLSVGEKLFAFVFDEAGKLVLNAEGKPHTVEFTVLRAEIDKERGLFVQLSTADEPYCKQRDPTATVQISLQYETQRLSFPPVEIRAGEPRSPYPSGVATLWAKLKVGVDVRQIPIETLRVTVQPLRPSEM